MDGLTFLAVSNGSKQIAPGAAGGGQATGILRPGGGLGGPGPLQGTAIANVLGLFNLSVPLAVVGNTGASAGAVQGGISVTVLGTGWTTGSVAVTGLATTATPATFSAFFAGADLHTPGHAGSVQLISPFKVITNVGATLGGVARQNLYFVPAPGTFGLLLLGAAAYALQGARQQRRRRRSP